MHCCVRLNRTRLLFLFGITVYSTVMLIINQQLKPSLQISSELDFPLMQHGRLHEDTLEQQLHPDFTLSEELAYLFDHVTTLNLTRLRVCPVTETQTQVRFHSKYDTGIFTDKRVYNLLVPKWQSSIHKVKKYFLTAVLMVRLYADDKAKWTIAELKQWLHYQFWAGTEHVYICNHFLSPSENVSDLLEKYVQQGLVTVFPWNTPYVSPGMEDYYQKIVANQIGCYNHVLVNYRNKTVWFYSFDMDEYPYSTTDHCEGFFSNFIRDIERNTNDTVAAISAPNFILKGQGDRSRDLVIDRIQRITPNEANNLVKPVYKAQYTVKNGVHGDQLTEHKEKVSADPYKFKMLHYWGARTQNWGPDNNETYASTVEFKDVREALAVIVRHSLLKYGEFRAFHNSTGP